MKNGVDVGREIYIYFFWLKVFSFQPIQELGVEKYLLFICKQTLKNKQKQTLGIKKTHTPNRIYLYQWNDNCWECLFPYLPGG